MKFKTFQPRKLEIQTRFLSLHLPRGRVWNTKTGKILWKLVSVAGAGACELWNVLAEILREFRIDTSKNYLYLWEDSLGLNGDGLTLEQRRDAVKKQIRKTPTVSQSEWEDNLSEALGKVVKVYPVASFTPTSDYAFPYTFPHYFWLPNPSRVISNRFICIVTGCNGSNEVDFVKNILSKYKPAFNYVIIIDGDTL